MIGSSERIISPGSLGLETAHPFIYRRT
jgi:hypothetical protein